MLANMSTLLGGSGITTNDVRADQLCWMGCSSNKFSVKSFYNLCSSQDSNHDETFVLIWENLAPLKCFGWLVYLGSVKNL
ncbi:hypothetical protein RHMOL_Rhmol08G0124500 [Rhododendron molle]|uniref:Uncharacterized protein n=1 Tax=Rhododendron molle TaxID=49168 RepID=A0ACC0MNU7_RHOML|nr:hypothetical protein RHMOL_Rhmol08G0124500 [Rhododendron molle]